MADTLDYVVAAIIDRLRSSSTAELSSIRVLRDIFANAYDRDLAPDHAEVVARRLEQLGFIRRVSDEYAGTYFVPVGSINLLIKIARIIEKEPDSRIAKGLNGGQQLFSRVFANDRFWDDFRAEIQSGDEGVVPQQISVDAVPASDRIVTLSHNQQLELEESANDLIEKVSRENAIDGDSTVRQVVIGQLSAARELLRAQSFRAYLMYETLVGILNSLIEKYGGQAIGEAAKKLLDLLIEQVLKK